MRASLLALSCLLFAPFLSFAQQNVTVNATDTSLVSLDAPAAGAALCKYNANGTLESSQGGCYNVPSQCTQTAIVGQTGGGASFKFNGSALYITSLLYQFSPIFNITIDNITDEVDGIHLESKGFGCFPLYSKTSLDPNVEHTVKMGVKGPSPKSNASGENIGGTTFSFVSYTYTSGGTNSSSSTSTPSAASRPVTASLISPSLLIGFLALLSVANL